MLQLLSPLLRKAECGRRLRYDAADSNCLTNPWLDGADELLRLGDLQELIGSG